MSPTLQVIVASTRPRRVGGAVATWVADRVRADGRFDVEVQDLAAWALPLLDEPEIPVLGGYRHAHTQQWAEMVRRSDAFVLVTPEYNHGYPAALKNALDSVYAEWNHKPVGFVSYGGVSGGTRSTGQLKQVVTALRLHPAHPAVAVPFVAGFVDDDLHTFTPPPRLAESATAMLDEVFLLHTLLSPIRHGR